MKCNSCKFMVGEGASYDYPYPTIWCAKGHWEGIADEVDDDEDLTLWDDCKDYKADSEQA